MTGLLLPEHLRRELTDLHLGFVERHTANFRGPVVLPHAPVDDALVPGSVVPMGDGSTEYVFENVSSGPHRLIAVVADGAHLPLQPLVADTVEFLVE